MKQGTDLIAPTVVPVEEIRRLFPALERQHKGQSVAYFDGPGGTQVPRVVVQAMTEYLLQHNANTHWLYPTSLETDALLSGARQALADFLGASPDEVAFGANMTTLTFHLARALGRGWGPGDEIVITELDHHANVDPWLDVARERGLRVRSVAMRPETGALDLEDLERAITSRTRLLAIGAASNALGTITDVALAGERARAAGALVFVDAVHYAPHLLPDVGRLGCDFLVCSAYKFYGPHVGVLYGRRERIESLDLPKLAPAPDYAPERLETGTQNHEGIVGAAAAVDFLASLGGGGGRRSALLEVFRVLEERGRALLARLWNGLSEIPGLILYGPRPGAPRTPTLAFSLPGRTSAEVASTLAQQALFLSHGDFYASTAVRRLGQQEQGLVRAGCACYTTSEEVDRLIASVRRLART
jgi:cysteine desulfurase family protein (TIGR01976 family)